MLNDLRAALEDVLAKYGVPMPLRFQAMTEIDEALAQHRRPKRNTVLRELFAAQAPHEIPDWFQPVLPPLPALPKLPKVDVPHKLVTDTGDVPASTIIQCSMNRYLKKLEEGEAPDALDIDYPTLQTQFGMKPEEIDAVYDPFYRAVKPYRDAMNQRQTNAEKLRQTQWPWAWADGVIAQRSVKFL